MLFSNLLLFKIILLSVACRGVLSLVHSSYVGCYEDSDQDRKLRGYKITLANMTAHICNYICFQKGFEFAGIQKKKECYCGDYDDRPHPQALEDDLCEDSSSLDVKTGENERLTLKVYRTGIEDATDLESKLVGCVSEKDPNYLVPRHKMDFTSTNSPGRCVAACASLGFKHAGLSQSTICYCGEARSIEKTSGCDSPCPKKSKTSCGGYSKTSLYITRADPGLTPTQVLEMGCFKNRPGGLLKDFREKSAEMTLFRCTSTCFLRGSLYAGLHNGNECQCSLQQPSPSPEQVPSEFCSASPCSGNKSEPCGSREHVKAYSTAILGRHQLYGKSMGCFQDTEFTPKDKTIKLDNNSPIKCVAECIKNGYAFAAVKQTECRCGNVLPKYSHENILSDTSCDIPCSDSTLTCGGASALAIYRTGLDFKAQDGCTKSETKVKGERVCSGKLIFEDNFDTLDYNKWQRTVRISGEDYEFVTYSYEKGNSFVKDGKLHIKPTLETDENHIRNGKISLVGCTGSGEECEKEARFFNILPPIKSAQFTTKNVFTFKYGKINIRAKLPQGDWIYPQIWLKPLANAYGPSYWSGKLLLATSMGNANLTTSGGEDISTSRVQSGIILGELPDTSRTRMVSFKGKPWSDDFHNYSVIWSPDSIVMYVDDERHDVKSIVEMNDRRKLASEAGFSEKDAQLWETSSKAAPFDQQFYLTLGLGVGGYTTFPDFSTSLGKPKPWNNYQVKALLNFWQAKKDWLPTWTDNSDFIVDYISVHAL